MKVKTKRENIKKYEKSHKDEEYNKLKKWKTQTGFQHQTILIKESTRKLEDRSVKLIKSERQKKVSLSEDSLRDLWDTKRGSNIYIYSRDPRRRQEKRAKNLLKEKMAENFPNLGKESNSYQEAQKKTNLRS